MNLFDFILLLPLAYFCYKGIRKGFVKRVFAILGLILGALASYFYHALIAELVSEYWQNPAVDYLAYIIPFILVVILAKLIATTLTKGLKIIALNPINVFLGALFGIIQGALFSAVISLLTLTINNLVDTPLKSLSKNSVIYGYAKEYLSSALDFLSVSV